MKAPKWKQRREPVRATAWIDVECPHSTRPDVRGQCTGCRLALGERIEITQLPAIKAGSVQVTRPRHAHGQGAVNSPVRSGGL